LQQVWDPDSAANADWLGAAADTVVLLDGAAPQHPHPVSGFANDAVWLVRRFVEIFTNERGDVASGGASVAERVESARSELAREYRSLCAAAGFAPVEAPFACLALAHEAGSRLELLNMGDLTLLLQRTNGAIERFGDSAVRTLDREALGSLEREIAAGTASHGERVANVWPQIQRNRRLRNVLAGYDVLDPHVSCEGRMQRCCVQRSSVRSFLMLSDGFYRLVDTYRVYTDASLFQAVERSGLSTLLRELRSIEAEDAHCVRYPRFKQHDDATALWIT
jgi:hypothetical protein